jgi:hypothetical protein
MLPNVEIVMMSLDDLQLDPRNPRQNSGAVEKLADSIRQFGFRVPLVVNPSKLILAGHTRYAAAALLGMDSVPCIVADDLTEEQQRAFNIADNRVSDYSFWDVDKLTDLVAGMDESFTSMFDLDALIVDDFADLDLESSSRKDRPSKREGLDLAPFEKYQYVTVICRSTYDYLNLLAQLGLEDTQSRYVSGVMKRGSSYGRIIEYSELVKLLKEDRP